MSNKILAVNRDALAPELIQEAAKEALKLRDNIQYLGFSATMNDYEGAGVSPFMLIQINNSNRKAFETEAPGMYSLLDEMTSIPSVLEGVHLAPLRSVFDLTINYCDVGTEVAPHSDVGNRYYDRVSRIATLCGKALFGINVRAGEPPISPITVEAGDIHELLNPKKVMERPEHWAKTIGDEDRISFVYQEFVIPAAQV